MRRSFRRYTLLWTGALSIGALAVVFAVVGGLVPESSVPAAPSWFVGALPHLNAVISLLALGAIGTGILAIRRGEVDVHRRRMGAAFGLFVAFLAFYLYRLIVEGTKSFAGPSAIEPVYLLVLAVHVTLAIVCLPLLFYVLVLAYGYDIAELPSTNHPRVGRIAAALWAISFALGIVVYLSLYVVFPG